MGVNWPAQIDLNIALMMPALVAPRDLFVNQMAVLCKGRIRHIRLTDLALRGYLPTLTMTTIG